MYSSLNREGPTYLQTKLNTKHNRRSTWNSTQDSNTINLVTSFNRRKIYVDCDFIFKSAIIFLSILLSYSTVHCKSPYMVSKLIFNWALYQVRIIITIAKLICYILYTAKPFELSIVDISGSSSVTQLVIPISYLDFYPFPPL